MKQEPAVVLVRIESPQPGSEAELRLIREAVEDAERGVLVHPLAMRETN